MARHDSMISNRSGIVLPPKVDPRLALSFGKVNRNYNATDIWLKRR
jgi:hypothetical protein